MLRLTVRVAPGSLVLLASSFVLILAFSRVCLGDTKPAEAKIAEGEYLQKATTRKVKDTKVDHWVLWRRADGTYRVDVSLFPNLSQQSKSVALEELALTSDFELSRFEFSFLQPGSSDVRKMEFHCDLEAENLRCQSSMNDMETHSSVAVRQPYLFVPSAESPVFDQPWFFASLIAAARKQGTADAEIELYTVADTRSSVDFKLVRTSTYRVHRLGEEQIPWAGKKVSAAKYELGGGYTVWVSRSGLVLSYVNEKTRERVELVQFGQSEGGILPEYEDRR